MDNSVDLSRVLAWRRYLRSLPRRTRRALQRTCKQSLAGVALLFALGHAPAEAATITVNASCRLVNAIRAANTDTATGGCPRGSGADTIILPVGSTQALTTVNNSTFGPSGLPVINSVITIEGRNSTIWRAEDAPGFRILTVSSTGKLVLKETVVSGGVDLDGSSLDGGGVFNAGRLTIANSSISGSVEFGDGGGIFNTGVVTITNSSISGGGSYCRNGGGILNSGVVTITNSSISGGCRGGGGGITNMREGTLTLMNSTISGSRVHHFGVGGGIDNGGILTIINSTLSDNYAAYYGGGIANGGILTITNSTISGNSAAREGGGISSGSGLTLIRTLVSGNMASVGPEILGAIVANNFNLFGHDGEAGVEGFTPGATDVVPTVPLSAILNPTLANNGGPTLTHALVPGSPALDAVRSGCPPPATDQRRLPRPQGLRCDIGAVEATFCVGGNLVTHLGTPGNDVLTGTASRDVMAGLGGNDTLNGQGGDDILCGGDGNDTLRGGAGADLLAGQPGNDWLFGGLGQDWLLGQKGRDQLFGGPANDTLEGGLDDDGLNGEAGVDRCDGGPHANGDTAVNCETILNVP